MVGAARAGIGVGVRQAACSSTYPVAGEGVCDGLCSLLAKTACIQDWSRRPALLPPSPKNGRAVQVLERSRPAGRQRVQRGVRRSACTEAYARARGNATLSPAVLREADRRRKGQEGERSDWASAR